jgi:hypothetical protein
MSPGSDQSQLSHAFICPHCDLPALGVLRGVAVREEDDESLAIEWSFVQCDKCHDVSLQRRVDWGGGFDADSPDLTYPEQRSLSGDVPAALRREFTEAQTCFSAKAYQATVVMVRRVLEGTCKENNVQERTLARSLQKMKDDGLIDGTLAEWVDALRVLGNEGAHYTGRQVSRDDAEDSLAFAEALLDHIYVLRKRFEEFAKRRANKKSKTE